MPEPGAGITSSLLSIGGTGHPWLQAAPSAAQGVEMRPDTRSQAPPATSAVTTVCEGLRIQTVWAIRHHTSAPRSFFPWGFLDGKRVVPTHQEEREKKGEKQGGREKGTVFK